MKLSIGVIGAGTMGAGIAFVALKSGRHVILFDVSTQVLEKAKSYIHSTAAKLVKRGTLSEEDAQSLVDRLTVSSALGALQECEVVIEAVPEKMELKQKIFTELDEICDEQTILATNTSSLSVTVIQSALRHPERFVGMHFFNPAPVMKLVEVVEGTDTSRETTERIVKLSSEFNKQAIVCKDTPGFIVNRVARNFYGETLRIVGEGTALQEDVDTLMTSAAHFKMGPFTLMDLIGIDVNLDVTKAVYEMFHGEPRYRPHRLQELLVKSNRLGRKTGRGFYRYDEEGNPLLEGQMPGNLNQTPIEKSAACRIVVIGDTPMAKQLSQQIRKIGSETNCESALLFDGPLAAWDEIGRKWRADEVEAFLRRTSPDAVFVSLAGDELYERTLLQAIDRVTSEQVPLLVSLAGPSATERASWLSKPSRVRGFHLLPWNMEGKDESRQTVELSRPLQSQGTGADTMDDVVAGLINTLSFVPVWIRDGAGGVVMRTLSMIFNEAVEVLREGIANPGDIDVAMRLGTNYPLGPFEWMQSIGTASVYKTLISLFRELGEDRYRPSPMLRQAVLAGTHFQSWGTSE